MHPALRLILEDQGALQLAGEALLAGLRHNEDDTRQRTRQQAAGVPHQTRCVR
jgi:hypothetical protein